SRRRTRIIATGAANSSPLFVLQRLVEDPLPAATASWVSMSTFQVASNVFGESFAMQVGSHTALSASLLTNWSNFQMSCYPSGSCDAVTLFFQSTTGNAAGVDYQARVSMFPLGTAALIRYDWN